MQANRANAGSPHTIMIPFTSKIRQRLLPSHVFVPTGEGELTQDSVALAEQIRAIDFARLIRLLGKLPDPRMLEVDKALRTILSV